jgi:N-acetyl-anhydromuramyl-L-alanine amidase AmpD
MHAVNAAWFPADKVAGHYSLSLKRLDDFHHVLPWQNLLHAGQENLFSGLTALTAEFTVGEGKLIS